MINIRFLTVIILVLFFPFFVFGENIASDNFDGYGDGYHAGGLFPGDWSWYQWGGTTAIYGGVQHYSGEITAPGHGGAGKSLKVWRTDGYFGDYTGVLGRELNTTATHFFMSYWWKIPIEFDSTEWAFKVFRINTNGGGEIGFNFYDGDEISMRNSGTLSMYSFAGYWTTILDNNQLKNLLWDGNWHWVQFEFDTANSVVSLDIDGQQVFSTTNYDYTDSTNQYPILLQHLPIGNTFDHEGGWQTGWQAMEVDDFSMDTEKLIYPGGDEIEPNSPTGLNVL